MLCLEVFRFSEIMASLTIQIAHALQGLDRAIRNTHRHNQSNHRSIAKHGGKEAYQMFHLRKYTFHLAINLYPV